MHRGCSRSAAQTGCGFLIGAPGSRLCDDFAVAGKEVSAAACHKAPIHFDTSNAVQHSDTIAVLHPRWFGRTCRGSWTSNRKESSVTDDKHAEKYLLDSIHLAMGNVRQRKTWPFGAVIVRDGEVIVRAVNEVDALCDPSAHAEMQAVRAAAKSLNSTDLSGCTVYASGYPCPMCVSAMYLSGVKAVYYAYSNEDGEPYDLSAEKGYIELAKPLAQREMKLISLPVRAEGEDLYEAWKRQSQEK